MTTAGQQDQYCLVIKKLPFCCWCRYNDRDNTDNNKQGAIVSQQEEQQRTAARPTETTAKASEKSGGDDKKEESNACGQVAANSVHFAIRRTNASQVSQSFCVAILVVGRRCHCGLGRL